MRVAGPNTSFAGVSIGSLNGEGHVDFVMDRLPLMPGNWRLSVAIVDEKMLHTYDHLEEGFEFHVQPGSSVERYGIADLQGRWAVDE